MESSLNSTMSRDMTQMQKYAKNVKKKKKHYKIEKKTEREIFA